MYEKFVDVPVFDESLPFSIILAGESYCDGTYHIERFDSRILCIEYVISGTGTVKLDGKTYTASAGDTYVLLPGCNHEYYSSADDPWVKIWVNARGPLIDSLMDTYGIRGETVFHVNTKRHFDKMHAALLSSLSTTEIAHKCAIAFHALVQDLAMNSSDTNPNYGMAESIKEHIDKNIAREITLDELSELIGRSNAHAIRIFKAKYGITPYQYCIDSRIKKAVAMLESTNYSVKEISFRLGFCDEHYFSGFLKSKTGKSPTEYRKSSRLNK